jgi:hypothetical protein
MEPRSRWLTELRATITFSFLFESLHSATSLPGSQQGCVDLADEETCLLSLHTALLEISFRSLYI